MLSPQLPAPARAELLELAHAPERIHERLVALGDPWADEIRDHHAQRLETLAELQAFAERIAAHKQPSRAERNILDHGLHALLRRWFERKLVVIEDRYAPGDAIIDRLCRATPPRHHSRIMGLMNIKGTGLGHIYCWESWQRCAELCDQLESATPQALPPGLRRLAEVQDLGLLCEDRVRQLVQHLRRIMPPSANPELERILTNLDQRLAWLNHSQTPSRTRRWQEHGLRFVEALLDSFDAIRRRHRADQIYRDLATERITHARAAHELQALVERQKGGWLERSLTTWVNRRRAQRSATLKNKWLAPLPEGLEPQRISGWHDPG